MDKQEAGEIMSLAIGRLFQMGSRPEQIGDTEMFYKIKVLVLEAAEILGLNELQYELNYSVHRNIGAQGN